MHKEGKGGIALWETLSSWCLAKVLLNWSTDNLFSLSAGLWSHWGRSCFFPLFALLGREEGHLHGVVHTGTHGDPPNTSLTGTAPQHSSHRFWQRAHLPLPMLAGQPSCNVWQRHKSLLCYHHSQVIKFALPGIPVCHYIFILSVVGYKTKQGCPASLQRPLKSWRVLRISSRVLGTGARGAEKNNA